MKKTISVCRLILLLAVLLATPFATMAVAQDCKPGDPNCPKPKPEQERELDEDDC